RRNPKCPTAALLCWLAIGATYCASAQALTPISDEEMALVRGQDGIAFNLLGFSLFGPNLSFALSSSKGDPNPFALTLSDISISRSDDPASTYSDPYTLTLTQRGNGLSDVITLTEPQNALGKLEWQFAANFSLYDGNTSFNGGGLLVQNLRSYGNSVSIASSSDPSTQGIELGLQLQFNIGAISLRPNGLGDITKLNDPNQPEQLSFEGIHLAAATVSGTLGTTPWVLANVTSQPLTVNTIANADGTASLHFNLAWPAAGYTAPAGSLAIDDINFASAAGASMDLGSSHIGSMQIQYMDIKFRTGP
ncbi:MAG: hypothetical protein JO370_07170, partial [Paucibacter sp.]|nr:hypothetical protein [Roseateles sp.]